jgi:hypothetical protein
MVLVSTFRKQDYEILLSSGMNRSLEPSSVKQNKASTCIKFYIEEDVFLKSLNTKQSSTILCLDGIPEHIKSKL